MTHEKMPRTKDPECHTILVVEDDAMIREGIKEALEMEGYRSVLTASNGREALEQLNIIAHPCLILLDLMMPIMSGWEMLKVMKSTDALVPIPIVLVSAAGEDRLRSVKAETQGYIKKPIHLDTLLSWVEKYCGKPDRRNGEQ